MAEILMSPKLAKLIEVTETDVIVDGMSIAGWLTRDPVTVVAAEGGRVEVYVRLTASTVRTTVEPHPENRPENL